MPLDLITAHKALDTAVLTAYGLKDSATDGEVLAMLLSRYEQYANPLGIGHKNARPSSRRKGKQGA